jgi:hypothetical protein
LSDWEVARERTGQNGIFPHPYQVPKPRASGITDRERLVQCAESTGN